MNCLPQRWVEPIHVPGLPIAARRMREVQHDLPARLHIAACLVRMPVEAKHQGQYDGSVQFRITYSLSSRLVHVLLRLARKKRLGQIRFCMVGGEFVGET